ncbi:unnamed protein product [Wickerhamomyces anomalus]
MVGFIADEVKFFKKNRKSNKAETENSVTNIQEENFSQLKDFLPKIDKTWIKTPHLVHLNILMFIVTLSATNTGYDGSLLNAFQSMPDWRDAMGKPSGAVLGALNNGTVSIYREFATWIKYTNKIERPLVLSLHLHLLQQFLIN